WDRSPYLLNEVGDSSVQDRATLLVVRRGNGWDRMVLDDHQGEGLKEIELEPGLCDEAVAAYCSWVEQLPMPM
ncbi:MAG TPA: hypothetical protein VND93_15910, partial [Myxococcales bacterium]|nr:hypothetical protein [Myxococcales bacterium]